MDRRMNEWMDGWMDGCNQRRERLMANEMKKDK